MVVVTNTCVFPHRMTFPKVLDLNGFVDPSEMVSLLP